MTRRLAFVLCVAVSALGLAACGGGGDGGTEAATTAATTTPDESADVLASAATKAAGAGSSRVDFAVTTHVPGQEGPVSFTGTGAFDYEGQRGTFTYDFGDLVAGLGQDVPGADEPVEIVYDGLVVYMRWPFLSAFLPGAKEWLKLDLEAASEEQGFDLAQLQQLNQTDPTAILQYLRGTGSVEEVGAETIDGVDTTHYEGVIELDRVAEQAPPELRAQVESSIEQLEQQSGVTDIPVDVWIDSDGLPRRIQYEYELSLEGDTTSSIITVDFYDYGVDVEVEPPPAAEVTDLLELTAGLGFGEGAPEAAGAG